MVSQEEFDALSAEFHALKVKMDTWEQNLLGPASVTPGTLRFGSNDMELSHKGIVSIANDSGDSMAESPNTNVMRWVKNNFSGTELAQIFGGYTTPSTLQVAKLILRALADGSDFATADLGVWSESTLTWNPLLQVANTLATQVLFLGTSTVGGSTTPWLTVNRTDADNFKLYIRQGATLVELTAGGLLTDTAWAAKGDLVAGTANDTAAILSIGVDGMRLMSDSGSSATGLRWESLFGPVAAATGNGNTNLTSRQKYCRFSSLTGAKTATIYSAATVGDGDAVVFKRTDTSGNSATILTTSSQTIDGQSSLSLGAYETVTLVSDGSNWDVI